MDITTPAVAPTSAIPSSTFSTNVVNAVLCMFLESCATIEDIANQNNLSITTVMQCIEEQKPFLRNMLDTLELRVRLLASRAEAVAIETLRDIAHLGRDSEARRKSASKLLSHFKRPVTPTRQRAGSVSDRPSAHTSTDDAQSQTRATSAPSPRPSEGSGDDEGPSPGAPDARSQTHSEPPNSSAGTQPPPL